MRFVFVYFQTVMSSRLERLPDNTTPVWQLDLTSTGCFVCLLGAVAYVVMSTKKKVSAIVKKNNRRSKKVRSISMSLDLECPGRIPHGNHLSSPQEVTYMKKPTRPGRVIADRNRTVSACEFVEQYLVKESLSKSELLLRLSKLSSGTRLEEDRFPFGVLPPDCKLKVFSFLTTKERGIAAQVCREWRALIKTSSLWNVVDFAAFPLCHIKSGNHQCSELCYAMYRQRMKKFFGYITAVRPVLKRLKFSFDIGDFKDGWLECLLGLLDSARCQELEFAHLNWKESPLKPFQRDSITWSSNDYKDLMSHHRHRQRLFVNFFDQFTAAAPNVSELILPFDWSQRSLRALTRLQCLEKLVLEKYFVFQTLEQDHLDQLFRDLPGLRELTLEVWTPSGYGLLMYSVDADNLQYLDISQCRGFYLQSLYAPSLEVFRINRHSWSGPLSNVDSVDVPCVHHVLREGAPDLIQINDHILHPDWRENVYPELATILNAVCSCRQHKSNWAV